MVNKMFKAALAIGAILLSSSVWAGQNGNRGNYNRGSNVQRNVVINNTTVNRNYNTNYNNGYYPYNSYGYYNNGCGMACTAGIMAGIRVGEVLLSEIIAQSRYNRQPPITIINQYPEPIGPNDPPTCRYVNYGQGWDAQARRSFPIYKKIC